MSSGIATLSQGRTLKVGDQPLSISGGMCIRSGEGVVPRIPVCPEGDDLTGIEDGPQVSWLGEPGTRSRVDAGSGAALVHSGVRWGASYQTVGSPVRSADLSIS